jgi:hypothetical protein
MYLRYVKNAIRVRTTRKSLTTVAVYTRTRACELWVCINVRETRARAYDVRCCGSLRKTERVAERRKTRRPMVARREIGHFPGPAAADHWRTRVIYVYRYMRVYCIVQRLQTARGHLFSERIRTKKRSNDQYRRRAARSITFSIMVARRPYFNLRQ